MTTGDAPPRVCPRCGQAEHGTLPCRQKCIGCFGSGTKVDGFHLCDSEGHVLEYPCPYCAGKGYWEMP